MLHLRAALAACALAAATASLPAATNLRTEFMTDPVALDEPAPRFSWEINCNDFADCPRGTASESYRIVVNQVACGKSPSLVWDSGIVASNTTSNVEYAGKPLTPGGRYAWSVVWTDAATGTSAPQSRLANFGIGPMGESGWGGAAWIAPPAGSNVLETELTVPASHTVCRATAFVAAPGGFSLFVGGAEASDRLGVMEWLQFDRTIFYHALDITNKVKTGSNSIVVMLGSGFWGHFFKQSASLRLLINLEYMDGTFGTLASAPGDAWRATAGAITNDDPFGGVTMDWSRWAPAGGAPGSQPAVAATNIPASAKLAAVAMPQARTVDTVQPNASFQLGPNHWRYEFPINTVGVLRISVPSSAPKGGRLFLKHGEVLLPNGSVSFPWNETEQTDVHIVDPSVATSITPRFTWHGFQYVEAIGSDGLELDGSLSFMEALTVHTDVESTGSLAFSGNDDAALLNAVQDITRRGQLNNVAAYMPTDCPTREKHGWLGDALSTAEEAMLNFGMAPVYRRFIRTMVDTQSPTGDLPGAIPQASFMADGAKTGLGAHRTTDISWTGAFPQISRWLMLYFGDTRSASDAWPALTKYVDMLTAGATNTSAGSIPEDFIWGDWCPTEARAIATPNTGPMLAAFNYILNLDAMAQMAAVLGKVADEAKYAALAAKARPVFYGAFFNKTTGLFGRTPLEVQSCTAAPLVLGGVVPASDEAALVKRFVQHIETANGNHLTFGSVGAKHVLPVLSALGRHDTAMTIATQRTFPSFGHWIAQGATTPWEDWSGIADPTHPPPPTHDHIFLAGGIGEWMYRSVAGISPAANGFNAIRIAPQVLASAGPAAANATLDTVRGRAAVAWVRRSSGVDVSCTIPVGTTATVAVPLLGAAAGTVKESGNTVWAQGKYMPGTAGISGATEANGVVTFDVVSGAYAFSSE